MDHARRRGVSSRASTGSLRILVLLQYYAPHRTGLTLHVQHLAESLVQRGHHVTVITARHDRSTPRHSVENGVVVRRLWAPLRISRGLLMPFHTVAVARSLGDADVVSVHTPMFETAFVGVLARLRRRPMVVTHHGDLVLPPRTRQRLQVVGRRHAHREQVPHALRIDVNVERRESHQHAVLVGLCRRSGA